MSDGTRVPVSMFTAIGILAVFTLTLSLAVLLPARADSIPLPGTPPTQFSVSGPAADQIQYQIFASETGEFNALQAGQIDLTDTPLNLSNLATFCPSGTSFWCTGVAPNPPDPQFGAQHDDFNLANNFWGITFCFAQDGITAGGACQPKNGAVTVPGYAYPKASCPNVPAPHVGDCTYAGIQWRQGFSALLNKVGLVANVFGGAAQALDNLDTVPAQGIQHSGLPFDSACSPTPVTGCIGSYSTGAPANYNLKGVCSWDSIHTTVAPYNNCTSALKYLGSNPSSDGVTWDAGSTNFCDAADHFIAAGIASGKDASCRLMTLLGPGGDVIFAIRSDSPNRLVSGVAEFTRFCDLLNAPTNGGQCSRLTNTGATLRLVYHPLTVTDAFTFVFSGFSTDSVTTNAPNLGWHLYTGANSWGPAFSQQWALYDGSFVSSICGGSSLSTGSLLQDYVYSCNTKMDHYTEMVEDNVTITGAAQSLQPAMEIFGNHTINNPTVSRTQQFGYAKGWTGVSDATGIGRATGNFWSLDNAWNPSPAISGPTIRWGMKQGTSILNPFLSTSVFEFNILQEVYDSLLTVAPYIPGTGAQIIGYMANTYSLVSHSGAVGTTDANCPASIGVFAVQGCMKISLRGDIFFQDGVQVTASDVKFSFDSLQPPNVIDVTFDPSSLPTSLGGTESPGQQESLYIALKWVNAFALLDIGGVPIVPQHIWKTIGAAGACTDTSISNPGSGRGFPQCSVDPSFLSGLGADAVANNRLIGSGPFACASGPLGAPGTVLGGGCTSTGTGAVTTGSITLLRYGQGVSHLSGSYFRNNAKYKEFAWAHTSSGNAVSILDVSAISGCFSNPAGPTCAHYRSPDTVLTCTSAGPCIGTVSGGNGGALTGLQKTEVQQWFGTSWTDPIAYGSLDGVLPAPPALYEDGSQYS